MREDLFVCFIVVALISFLCSNTNLVPSPKYFGVFEDIENARNYDWCGLVLSWLLGHIKAFNISNTGRGSSKSRQSLGGCIYYLAVCIHIILFSMFFPYFFELSCFIGCFFCLFLLTTQVMYLNHVDFRQRQVKSDIPRISVWKDNMIQLYSELDKKFPGEYGQRPLLDYESTCFAQVVPFLVFICI
jgi:hypothetical protein